MAKNQVKKVEPVKVESVKVEIIEEKVVSPMQLLLEMLEMSKGQCVEAAKEGRSVTRVNHVKNQLNELIKYIKPAV